MPKNGLVWDKGGSGLGTNLFDDLRTDPLRSQARGGEGDDARREGIRPVHRPNVFRYNRPSGKDRLHNAAKPVGLLEELIRELDRRRSTRVGSVLGFRVDADRVRTNRPARLHGRSRRRTRRSRSSAGNARPAQKAARADPDRCSKVPRGRRESVRWARPAKSPEGGRRDTRRRSGADREAPRRWRVVSGRLRKHAASVVDALRVDRTCGPGRRRRARRPDQPGASGAGEPEHYEPRISPRSSRPFRSRARRRPSPRGELRAARTGRLARELRVAASPPARSVGRSRTKGDPLPGPKKAARAELKPGENDPPADLPRRASGSRASAG